jgi:hypothetical protein
MSLTRSGDCNRRDDSLQEGRIMRWILARLVLGLALAATPALAYGPVGTPGPAGAAVRSCATTAGCCLCNPTSCSVNNCSRSGSWESRIETAAPGDTVLLEAGTYTPSDGALVVANGASGRPVTVANNAGGAVVVNGSLRVQDGWAVVEGIAFHSDASSYVAVFDRTSTTPITHVTLRHLDLQGGTSDGVRISGNVTDVLIDGCTIDGGGAHHCVKVRCDDTTAEPTSCTWAPARVTISNNRFSKKHFGTLQEDLLQIEGGGAGIVVEQNDFDDNPNGEDCVDMKGEGTSGADLTIRMNRISAAGCKSEGLLVQGNHTGNVLIERNYVVGRVGASDGMSIGAHTSNPTALIRNNVFDQGWLRLRRGHDLTVAYNTFMGPGSKFQVGNDLDDCPTRVTVENNVFAQTQMDIRGAKRCDGLRPDYVKVSNNVVFQTTGPTLGLMCGSGCSNAGSACTSAGDCAGCGAGCQLAHPGMRTGDPQLNGYHLGPVSAARDAADGGLSVSVDVDGNARPVGNGYDCGASESNGAAPPPGAGGGGPLAPPVLIDVAPAP